MAISELMQNISFICLLSWTWNGKSTTKISVDSLTTDQRLRSVVRELRNRITYAAHVHHSDLIEYMIRTIWFDKSLPIAISMCQSWNKSAAHRTWQLWTSKMSNKQQDARSICCWFSPAAIVTVIILCVFGCTTTRMCFFMFDTSKCVLCPRMKGNHELTQSMLAAVICCHIRVQFFNFFFVRFNF